MQVWQAILTKKVDFSSWALKSQISENARDLLKVPPSEGRAWLPSSCVCSPTLKLTNQQ